MVKILPMYLGAFLSAILAYFLVDWSKYTEGVRFQPMTLFIFISGLLLILVTLLVAIALVFSKVIHVNLLESYIRNFFIGLLFSMSYLLGATLLVSKVGILNHNWFVFFVLPIFIFVMLLSFDFLFFSINRY